MASKTVISALAAHPVGAPCNIYIYIYILLDVLLCSIAEYFYELCRILTSPQGIIIIILRNDESHWHRQNALTLYNKKK